MKTIYSLLGIGTMLALTASLATAQDGHKEPEKKTVKQTDTSAKAHKPLDVAPDKRRTSADLAASSESVVRGSSEGAVVAVDPKTHQMRTPTPEEMQALGKSHPAGGTSALRRGTGNAAGEGMREIHHHSGAEGVVLDESYMSSVVATVGPDGKVSYKCVEGSKDGSKAKATAATGVQAKKGGAADVQ